MTVPLPTQGQTVPSWMSWAAQVHDATTVGLTTVSANTYSGSMSLTLADAGRIVEVSTAAPNTVTIPTDALVNFPIGTVIDVIQLGSGQTTISPASGVIARTATGLACRTQNSVASLRKRAVNDWVISGDLA